MVEASESTGSVTGPEGRVAGWRRFWAEYKQPIFWNWDAKLGYITAIVSWVLLTSGPAARETLLTLPASGITVAALALTFVLASTALLSAMLDEDLVDALDGLEERHGSSFGLRGLIVAFRSTAAIAALTLMAWLTTQAVRTEALSGNGWETARVIAGGSAAGLTVWLVGAIIALVAIISVLVAAKAQLIRGKRSSGDQQQRRAL